jgi:GDP/UDP-N,N'-diacetylbacillosamine 2-epimerase (hydrolysing)
VYHPVLQQASGEGAAMASILDALAREHVQVVALKPNSDAGSHHIREELEARGDHQGVRVVTHFPRPRFVSWMAAVDVMVGNTSAGIIEAATFGTPVVNVGLRQNLRERNANVIDVPAEPQLLDQAIRSALAHGRYTQANIYGDGTAARRIVTLLESLPLGRDALLKTNSY